MLQRLRRILLSTPAYVVGGLVAAYLMASWLAFEPLARWALPKLVAEQSGYRLQLEHASFNPFRLAVELQGVSLVDPAGKPLFELARGVVNLDSTGLFRRSFSFDEVRLEQPVVAVEVAANGRINWLAFVDAMSAHDEPAQPPSVDGAPPRMQVRHFVLANGRVNFSDDEVEGGFKTRFDPLNLVLDDLSTLPQEQGHHELTAHLQTGADVRWQGQLALNPIEASGEFTIDHLALASLWPYVEESVRMAAPAGTAALKLSYRAGYAKERVSLKLDRVVAKVEGLRIVDAGFVRPLALETAAIDLSLAADAAMGGAAPEFNVQGLALAIDGIRLHSGSDSDAWLRLGRVALEGGEVNLASRSVGAARVTVSDGAVTGVRDAKGALSWVEALARVPSAAAVPAPPASAASAMSGASAVSVEGGASPAWHYRVGQIGLEKLGVALRDDSTSPPTDLALEDITARVDGLSDDAKSSAPVSMSLGVRSGGRLKVEGSVLPSAPSADLKLSLSGLALKVAQPYLAQVAELALVSGSADTQGRLRFERGQIGYEGSFGVRDLAIQVPGSRQNFLAWSSLSTQRLTATPQKLSLGAVNLTGLDTRLMIDKDGSVNVVRAFHPKVGASPVPPASEARSAPPSAFRVDVERVRLTDGRVDFSDLSLALPFAARIQKLDGQVVGLSTVPGAAAQIEMAGQVDEYGLARINGRMDLLDPTDAMDLKVQFRNVEMTSLTPYSATFAGRRIASGKLSLDLDYALEKRRLKGENKVVMDQLTLGERVESPEATQLPLDLALAILQDSDGRIDLGLPVSGSLDDPSFSVAGIVWKAFTNVITKLVTAPFRAIGALFGGGGDDAPEIVFDAGAAVLLPPEREKLDQLAKALAKRPRLAVVITGGYNATLDGDALKALQFRRTLAQQMGRAVSPDSEPGPFSATQPEVRQALEALYAKAFGAEALQVIQRPPPAQGSTPLPEPGALMMERLTARELLPADRLPALARQRAQAVQQQLDTLGLAAERMQVAAEPGTQRNEKPGSAQLGVAVLGPAGA